MYYYGAILIIFGISVIIFPDLLAILVGSLLIIIGGNILVLGFYFRNGKRQTMRLGGYEIFKGKR